MEEEISAPVGKNKCPECSSTNLKRDYDTGELICLNCGLVIEETMIDSGPDWKAFTEEERLEKEHAGMPTTLTIHDKGFPTYIGYEGEDKDVFGKKLSIKTKIQIMRLRKWQKWLRVLNSQERNYSQAMSALKLLSEKFLIPRSILENTARIYREAYKKGLVKGREIKLMVAASFYFACRNENFPISLNEVAQTIAKIGQIVDRKEIKEIRKNIADYYRVLLKTSGIKQPLPNLVNSILKIGNRIGVSGSTQGLAIRILQVAKEKKVQAGKDPLSIAAAALYIACLQNNEKKTQKEIADIAGITEVTVRNRYKELVKRLGIKIPK
jgi:transcription initiation factor TFIIB